MKYLLTICYQICHRRKHKIKGLKGKGEVHKKMISPVILSRTQLSISKETDPDER